MALAGGLAASAGIILLFVAQVRHASPHRPLVATAPRHEPGAGSHTSSPGPYRPGRLPRGHRLKSRQDQHKARRRPAASGLSSQSAKADFVLSLRRLESTEASDGAQLPGPTPDLAFLNQDPTVTFGRWGRVRAEEMAAMEAELRRAVRGGDRFVAVPLPRIAAMGPQGDRSAAEAVAAYKREAAVIDSRLFRKVTLALKGTALSDLCDHLRAETGIALVAGQSVADEKVTLFCKETPLRDVMRQLSRPFGYAWLRSGNAGEYKYELTQDLRSQLMEEELRNRDRNAALIALDREIERYRPFLNLSPDEALARSKTATAGEKKILENLGNKGWGPIQMYFRLSRSDLEALRAGQRLRFSQEPGSGEQPLPANVARGVLQSWRDAFLFKRGGVFHVNNAPDSSGAPADALLPAATPEARARVSLELVQSELGQFTLEGSSGYEASVKAGSRPPNIMQNTGTSLARGQSPSVLQPENGTTNARLARDPPLRARVTVHPQPSCRLAPAGETVSEAAAEPRVTSADVLEALHRASGLPIVSDYYTRLYTPEAVSVQGKPAFDALNALADAMRLRWDKDRDGGWLQFRSTSFFYDRLKEVPNRLLTRWAAGRRQHGVLTLDHLLEIAQLPDAQLDAREMAEGARAIFGLAEWEMACSKVQRPHLRYVATFTPAQRQEAVSPAGLPFTRMSLAQQQQFMASCLPADWEGLQSLDELAGAALRVDYSLPGWYEWRAWSWYRWAMPTADGKRVLRPPLRERTREAALQAARRYFSPFAAPMVKAERAFKPTVTEAQLVPQEADIVPTARELQITYFPGSSHRHPFVTFRPSGDDWRATWEELGK
jgi:hypothetical protein